jgi:hypothetical protein
VGRRARTGRSVGGGDGIPAFGESRLRLAAAVAAGALLGLLVAYPATATPRLVALVAGLGIGGWTLLVVALATRWASLIGWALAIFGAEYAVFLRLRGGSVDSRAPFVAAALVLVAELSFAAVSRARGRAERTVVMRSALALAGAAAGAAIVGGVVLVAAGSVGSGLAFEAVAVVAATVAVAVVVRIAARTRESTSSSA